jgi:hypothetical protein
MKPQFYSVAPAAAFVAVNLCAQINPPGNPERQPLPNRTKRR